MASSCQAEMMVAGVPYPRTCPTCGLGPCQKGHAKGAKANLSGVDTAVAAAVDLADNYKPSGVIITDDFEKLYEDCHAAGGMSKYAWEDDPKRLTFTLARYKHVAKMLEGMNKVLEVGCADGYGTRIVRQHVNAVFAVDLDEKSIEEARKNMSPKWPVNFLVKNIIDRTDRWALQQLSFDAVYCLDVLEHIEPGPSEKNFLNALSGLAPVCIIGTPSLESQAYASRLSKLGHVNCKSGSELKNTLSHYWDHVFMFSMNDEAIGTGFLPMAHYLVALCIAR